MTYPNLSVPDRATVFHIDTYLPGGVVTHSEFETVEQVASYQADMQSIGWATEWVHPTLCTTCHGPVYAHDRNCSALPH